MGRLIDADIAVHNAQTISIQEILSGKRTKDFVQGYNPSSFYVGYERGCEDVIAAINATPAVDAVPVVRCKDCVYFVESHNNPIGADGLCDCIYKYTGFDNFCSYGERKEE